MNSRGRLAAFVVVVLLAAGGAVAWVAHIRAIRADTIADSPEVAARDDLATVTAGPHLIFRSTALGPHYGRVAVVPLSTPDGPRAFTPASCERVFAVTDRAICLSAERGLVTTYHSRLLGPDWRPERELPLQGLPSRARISADGTLAATTTFVYGDSYAMPGQFSTRTLINRTDGSGTAEDLETFALYVHGAEVTATDRNVWGVTFVDDVTFYATAASGGKTYLVRGSRSQRRLEALAEDVECPSLSPDGSRIAFKKHGDLPAGQWRLHVLDLSSGKQTPLAEVRSVDDQVVWLDDAHVIYGLPQGGSGTASSDVWSVPADGSGSPTLLVHDAWSPAVVR
jgi:hypothetical protein